jgi:hypothetical protein
MAVTKKQLIDAYYSSALSAVPAKNAHAAKAKFASYRSKVLAVLDGVAKANNLPLDHSAQSLLAWAQFVRAGIKDPSIFPRKTQQQSFVDALEFYSSQFAVERLGYWWKVEDPLVNSGRFQLDLALMNMSEYLLSHVSASSRRPKPHWDVTASRLESKARAEPLDAVAKLLEMTPRMSNDPEVRAKQSRLIQSNLDPWNEQDLIKALVDKNLSSFAPTTWELVPLLRDQSICGSHTRASLETLATSRDNALASAAIGALVGHDSGLAIRLCIEQLGTRDESFDIGCFMILEEVATPLALNATVEMLSRLTAAKRKGWIRSLFRLIASYLTSIEKKCDITPALAILATRWGKLHKNEQEEIEDVRPDWVPENRRKERNAWAQERAKGRKKLTEPRAIAFHEW